MGPVVKIGKKLKITPSREILYLLFSLLMLKINLPSKNLESRLTLQEKCSIIFISLCDI